MRDLLRQEAESPHEHSRCEDETVTDVDHDAIRQAARERLRHAQQAHDAMGGSAAAGAAGVDRTSGWTQARGTKISTLKELCRIAVHR